MLLLTSTSDLIDVVTSGAATVDVHASYMDYDGTPTTTPGRTNTTITTAATTTVVPSPGGASVKRNVKFLTIRNKDGAVTTDVTVRHNDGSTIVELKKVTLAPNAELHFIDGIGFLML